MKKNKLLIPLVAITSLGATAVPILTMVSCGGSDITKLDIAYSEATTVPVGTYIYKEDFTVTATKKDGSVIKVNEWTCSKFSSEGIYVVTDSDATVGYVTFDIKYLDATASMHINVTKKMECQFLHEKTILFKSTGDTKFSSARELYIFTKGLNPQRISGRYLEFKVFAGVGPDQKEVKDAVYVKQLASTDTYVICVDPSYNFGTVKHTLKAYPQGETAGPALAETEIVVASQTFSATFYEGQAELDLDAKMVMEGESKLYEDGTLIIPEFLIQGSEYFVVKRLRGYPENTKGIKNIIIPKSVTSIDENIFYHNSDKAGEALTYITFLGTSTQWAEVTQGNNWQGNLPIYIYCWGDNKYVKFTNRYETDFLKSAPDFSNQPAFVCIDKLGTIMGATKYVVQFNLSEIVDTTGNQNYKKMKHFEAINSNRIALGDFKFEGFYINGRKLNVVTSEESEGYRVDDEGYSGTFKAHITDAVTLSETDVINVAFTTPSFSRQAIEVALHTNKTWEE